MIMREVKYPKNLLCIFFKAYTIDKTAINIGVTTRAIKLNTFIKSKPNAYNNVWGWANIAELMISSALGKMFTKIGLKTRMLSTAYTTTARKL